MRGAHHLEFTTITPKYAMFRRAIKKLCHWYDQRPFWGAFCVLLAGLLVLWGPIYLLQSSYVPAETLRGGLEVGGLLFAIGLVQLFAPSYALVAGAIGVVLSIVSLITALGGFGVGMLLGVIGNSYAIAWQAKSKGRSRRVFWSVLSCSLVIVVGMVTLIAKGKLAVAAPIVRPYTVTFGRSECHNVHTVPAISSVDHRTAVNLFRADVCIDSHVVITQHILFGHTITITETSEILQNVTSEVVNQSNGMSVAGV